MEIQSQREIQNRRNNVIPNNQITLYLEEPVEYSTGTYNYLEGSYP